MVLYRLLEYGTLPICDKEALRCLGVDKLLYNSKFDISDYFTDDIAVLQRRSIVFGDALKVSGLYELLKKMTQRVSSISEILRSESDIGDKERSIFSAKQLQLYFEIVDEAEEYYTSLPDEEEVLDIPEFFNGINPENIYQFAMAGITKMADKRLRPVFGFYPEEDEATTVSTALKISYDNCRGSQRDFIMTTTLKNAENPKSINFRLTQKDETVEELKLYRDDFVQGGYHVYKVGTVKNLKDIPDTCLVGYDYGFLSVNINGIASIFPMNECDVYLSIRPQGELYGGKADEENAIFVDRLIIVKKN